MLAPLLKNANMSRSADFIYKIYSYTCHQLPERSLFILGDKLSYNKLELSELGYQTEKTNMKLLLTEGKKFTGNEEVGYKMAFCARDFGIYSAMLTILFITAFTNLKTCQIKNHTWIILMLPMVIDGSVQLLSSILHVTNMDTTFFYESNNIKRVITGALFGIGFASIVSSYLKKELIHSGYIKA